MDIKKLISIVAGISIIFIPYIAYPQQVNVERASREEDRPIRKEVEKKLRVPPKEKPQIKKEKEKAPEKIEGPKLFIKKITLIGLESFSPDDFKPIIEKYENREVGFEELDRLSKEIEREYLRKGVIAAAFIPPQEIKDGAAIVQVVEARMGKLEVGAHKYFNRSRPIYYWELKPDEILRYEKISRSLQRINKNPDRRAKAALRAGKKPGTTDVSLDVEAAYPLHTTFSIDKEGFASTGNWRKGAGFRHNNFLGFDDTLISGYMWGEHYWAVYGYHTIPITNIGTYLLYGYTYSRTNPKGDFERFDFDIKTKNASVFVYQDLYKKDKYLGDIFAGLDAKDKYIRMTTGTINRERYRMLRVGGNFVYREPYSVTYIKPQVSQGLNFFGARRTDRLTPRNAKNYPTILAMGIRHKKTLPFGMQFNMKIDSQFSYRNLTSQEQLSLGGIDSVRGYPASDYLADSGVQANVELLFPIFLIPKDFKLPYAPRPLKKDVTGLLFFDYAFAGKRGARKFVEEEEVMLSSVGAGLRINVFDQANVRLEWGLPIGDRGFWTNKPVTGSPTGRLHFMVDFEDKVMQELERVDKILDKRRKEKIIP